MKNIKLEFPELKHKKMYENMLEKWKEYEKIPTSPSRLFVWDNFENFLEKVKRDVINSDIGVNSSLFFLTDNEFILGAIQIRHHINHPNLIERWWHIGYWICPIHRNEWYATLMLNLWLLEAKKIWIDKVLVTCNIDNIASNKVIQRNGWIFESKITFEWEGINRYWFNLED